MVDVSPALSVAEERVDRVSPPAAPVPEPLTLEQHLGKCYEADVLRSRGLSYAETSKNFASALAEDGNMKLAARAKLEELRAVLAKRGNREYVTGKQVMYLQDAIGA